MTPCLIALRHSSFGYLLGSIPFGLIFTRLAGTQDIRAIGSGSIGATNVLRTGRKGLAAATLIADMLKGTVGGACRCVAGAAATADLLAGVGAFIGHLFPVWLRFKGGKGVATGLGMLLAVSWKAAAGRFAVIWLAVAAASRYSSLASLIAARAAPVILWFIGTPPEALLFVAARVLTLHHASRQHRAAAATAPRARSARKPTPRAHRERSGSLTTQRLDWLRLIRSDNVGPRTFRSLAASLWRCARGARRAARAGAARRRGTRDPHLSARQCRTRNRNGATDGRGVCRARPRPPIRTASPRSTMRRRCLRCAAICAALVAADDRDGRLAQCIRGGIEIRRTARARTRRGRLRDRVGPGARHRRGGPSRKPCNRDRRGAGRRS